MENKILILKLIKKMTVGLIYILFVALIVVIGLIIWTNLSVELYFMGFKLEKHPRLIEIIDKTAHQICEEEGIRVYHKSYEEINIKKTCEEDKALGMYIYTLDSDYQQVVNKNLNDIEQMELQYKLPYKEICALTKAKITHTKEDFVLPKILLCDSVLKQYGLTSYYGTFFHEIGHHFAVKERGRDHNEKDADTYAYMLMRKRLPFYFLLFYDFHYEFRLGKKEMSRKEKYIGYVEYLKYLITEKFDNFKLKIA